MALRAGYYGLKKKLLEKLNALPGIKSIGDGLSLNSTTGVLSATGGGGGTTVVANPEGEATTDLTKLQVGGTVYGVDSDCYKTTNDTESAIVDADYIPFLDSSAASGAGAPRKSTWSNFKSKILSTIISAIGTNESGEKASVAYKIGDHFYRNGKYCTVIAAISQGSDLILNTNYKEGTIAEHPGYVKIAESGNANDTLRNKVSSIAAAFENLTSAEKSESRLKVVPSDGAWEQILTYSGNHRYSIITDVQGTLFRIAAVDFVNLTYVTATGQTTGITFGDSSLQQVTWNLIIELLN